MSAVKLELETEYLRSFASYYISEVGFDPTAEQQMRERKINLAEVLQALRTGWVVYSEKEDACGALWIVEGTTCDDDRLAIILEVFVDRYHMCIKSISRAVRS